MSNTQVAIDALAQLEKPQAENEELKKKLAAISEPFCQQEIEAAAETAWTIGGHAKILHRALLARLGEW